VRERKYIIRNYTSLQEHSLLFPQMIVGLEKMTISQKKKISLI